METEVNQELADVHAQCERALRRLRALSRQHNDILLAQAMRSVRRAAELSAQRTAVPADRAA